MRGSQRSARWTELLVRAQGGERAAFDALVEEALPGLKVRALQKLGDETQADDVAVEALAKAWSNLANYNARVANARTWLCLIVDRLVLDALDARRRRRRKEVVGVDAAPGSGDEGSEGGLALEDDVELPPPQGADRTFRRALVAEALRRLEEGERKILVLREVEGKSYEEIAALLGCTVKAVGPRLSRARERFREALHPEAEP
jgi:RNA polymerase sigma-70 factor (ECF subfamily)